MVEAVKQTGTRHVSSEAVNISVNTRDSWSAQCFVVEGDTESGPAVLLWTRPYAHGQKPRNTRQHPGLIDWDHYISGPRKWITIGVKSTCYSQFAIESQSESRTSCHNLGILSLVSCFLFYFVSPSLLNSPHSSLFPAWSPRYDPVSSVPLTLILPAPSRICLPVLIQPETSQIVSLVHLPLGRAAEFQYM